MHVFAQNYLLVYWCVFMIPILLPVLEVQFATPICSNKQHQILHVQLCIKHQFLPFFQPSFPIHNNRCWSRSQTAIFSFLFCDGKKKGLVDLHRPFCSTDSQIWKLLIGVNNYKGHPLNYVPLSRAQKSNAQATKGHR